MQTIFAKVSPSVAHQNDAPQPAGPAASAWRKNDGVPGNSIPTGRRLVEMLLQSKLYQDYERAFTEATGLPLSLRPVDSWQLPHHGRRNENPFCAIMAEKSRSCAACLQVQQRLSDAVKDQPETVTCMAGMSDTAVPLRLGENLIGFLQTGQVFRKKPTEEQFERAKKQVVEWGAPAGEEKLRNAYFQTRVLTPKQHESAVKLLGIFAQHLAIISNQVLIQHQNAEPPVITRAKDFIKQHQSDDLSLGQVSKAVNTSPFYFCKLFKKVTGLNFTDYLSRLRIEKAKNLLLNPNLRVSEIAFEVGFQSLTHFNRVFKKITGQSPSAYRSQLPR